MIVYRHRRNDNLEIFYVGIGKTEKRAYDTKGRNKHWHNIVNKYGHTVEIIANPDTWEEACELEQLLIETYGRRDLATGNLVNMTNGGDGAMGAIRTDETRAKLSIAKSNISEETRAKMSIAKKGIKLTEEHKQKLKGNNIAKKGIKLTEEHKQKLREANTGKKMSEEAKSKIGKANKGRKLSENTKAKMSIFQSNRSDKFKEKMSKARQGAKSYSAKLTEEQAYEIKYELKGLEQKKIALMYGITKETVSAIRTNRNWKHI